MKSISELKSIAEIASFHAGNKKWKLAHPLKPLEDLANAFNPQTCLVLLKQIEKMRDALDEISCEITYPSVLAQDCLKAVDELKC